MRGAAVAAALILPAAGCGETLQPLLGGLEVARRGGVAFQMPVMANPSPPFRYPREALESGVGGEAVVRIHITAAGRVDSVELRRSTGHALLDSAAVAGARRLRYRPARRGADSVAVWARLPVRFPMPERQESP